MKKYSVQPLGFPWKTQDPFIFCVYHRDLYPEGNGALGPKASLKGRNLGSDFEIKDGWRMYHGTKVPGFPAHPHRGFETVTIVQEGLVDHSDSLGAAARFGNGDVQWMTAGKGVMHAEMFPLLKEQEQNPFELFQIWLNLPRKNKLVSPYFGMLWNEEIPCRTYKDANTNITTVKIVAGECLEAKAPTPPPDSWAAEESNEVAIWVIKMDPNAVFELPSVSLGVNRSLYFYEGNSCSVDEQEFNVQHFVEFKQPDKIVLRNGNEPSSFLLLQGRPIGEPVVQYGPFVMNTNQEIQQAFDEYQKTQFGGWPWSDLAHTHDPSKGRFAQYVDGSKEEKG